MVVQVEKMMVERQELLAEEATNRIRIMAMMCLSQLAVKMMKWVHSRSTLTFQITISAY